MVTWRQPGSGASVHTWSHQTGAPHLSAVSQLQYLHRLNMRKWFIIRERIDDSECDQMKLTPLTRPALWNYHKYELVAWLVVTGAWPGAQRHGVWPQNYPNQRSPAVSLYPTPLLYLRYPPPLLYQCIPVSQSIRRINSPHLAWARTLSLSLTLVPPGEHK